MDFSSFTFHDYSFIAVFVIIIFLFLMIDLKRLIKIIIANYIILVMAIGISLTYDLVFESHKNGILLQNINQNHLTEINNTLSTNQTMLVILFYFIILALLFSKSNIGIGTGNNKFLNFVNKLLFAPVTGISVLSTLLILILSQNILIFDKLLIATTYFEDKIVLKHLILLLPLWLIIPGFVVLLYSLDYKSFFKFGGGSKEKKTKKGFSFNPFKKKKKVVEVDEDVIEDLPQDIQEEFIDHIEDK